RHDPVQGRPAPPTARRRPTALPERQHQHPLGRSQPGLLPRHAFWGYFTLPNQLLRTDIRWTELAGGELQADYGSGLPVHSRIQRFWFDANSGLLRRNDYEPIAAAVGVKVANVVFEHAIAGGIPYAKKRRVKLSPVQYGWVLPAPDFITIDVESWRLS